MESRRLDPSVRASAPLPHWADNSHANIDQPEPEWRPRPDVVDMDEVNQRRQEMFFQLKPQQKLKPYECDGL